MAIKVTSILRSDYIVNSSCTFHGYCYLRLDNTRLPRARVKYLFQNCSQVRGDGRNSYSLTADCYARNSRYI